VLVAASIASAGTLNLWTASTCAGAPEGAMPGFNATPGNATAWVAPQDQADRLSKLAAFNGSPGTPNPQVDYDKGVIYTMADVGCRGDGVGHETISSLGLNIRKAGTGPEAAFLSATGFTVFTSQANTGTSSLGGPWSSPSPNTPTLNSGALLVSNSRAVAVPASTTDALWRGYTVNSGSGAATCGAGGATVNPGTVVGGHYRVARLNFSSATGAANDTRGHLPTSFNLFFQTGSLKITRVYDPTALNGGAPENVSFGYNGASPDTAVSGSTVGAESTNADAVVIIRRKGDFGSTDANGNQIPVPDGNVNSNDIAFFVAAVNTPAGSQTDLQRALGDYGSVDANGNQIPVRDCVVNTADIGFFVASLGS
jgi:hypothetical protein